MSPSTPTADLTIADRAKQLAAEAVDPARSELSRQLCAEEVEHRLRRDNPGANSQAISVAASRLLAEAEKGRR